ncbi:MAG: class II glutamine amidotransferase [Thermoplasmata archaeon]
MCRLFGMLSTKPSSAREFLIETECSLLKQSYCRRGREQKDGWGIGYYRGKDAQIIKSVKPVYKEKVAFTITSTEISSNIIIGHIRKASNPRKLSTTKLLAPENMQPFTYGRFIFAHNGIVQIPDDLEGTLGRYKRKIEGQNDSEVYFWLLMKNAEKMGMPAALEKTVNDMWQVWGKCKNRYKNIKEPYWGLNCMISDGETLYAFCKHDGIAGDLKSLCYGNRPYFRMCYALTKNSLVVASEPMDKTHKWLPIEDDTVLIGELKKGRISVSHVELPL